MQHHVAEHIAIDTEMTLASPTLIPRALTRPLLAVLIILHPFPPLQMPVQHTPCRRLPLLPQRALRQLLLRGNAGKLRETADAVLGVLLARAAPGDSGPVAQGEEVVVASRQVCGEEEGELAAGTSHR